MSTAAPPAVEVVSPEGRSTVLKRDSRWFRALDAGRYPPVGRVVREEA
jgi:hypothetical protein